MEAQLRTKLNTQELKSNIFSLAAPCTGHKRIGERICSVDSFSGSSDPVVKDGL